MARPEFARAREIQMRHSLRECTKGCPQGSIDEDTTDMKTEAVDKTIMVDGVEVKYRTSGPVNDRLPLVLVHGTAGSIDSHFGFLFPMMAFRQRVIGINLADPGTDQIEIDQFVAQIRAVIEAEVPEGSVTLLGYSMGAPIAAKTAHTMGDKVANLIMVAGYMKTDTHQKLRGHIWMTLYKEGNPLVKNFMSFNAFSPFHMRSKSLEDMLAGTAKMNITPFLAKQVDLNGRMDVLAECEQLQARTLVVGLAEDFSCPKHHSKAIFGTIINASYTEIATGHAVVHERPAELYYHVNRFCQDQDLYPIGKIVPAPKP
jgi:pimeloyl-ACP methyl ester carboxylesterase